MPPRRSPARRRPAPASARARLAGPSQLPPESPSVPAARTGSGRRGRPRAAREARGGPGVGGGAAKMVAKQRIRMANEKHSKNITQRGNVAKTSVSERRAAAGAGPGATSGRLRGRGREPDPEGRGSGGEPERRADPRGKGRGSPGPQGARWKRRVFLFCREMPPRRKRLWGPGYWLSSSSWSVVLVSAGAAGGRAGGVLRDGSG